MKQLKKFEEFLSLGTVWKQNKDIERAKSLVSEVEDKFNFFKRVKEKMGIDDLSPNFVVETCYDILLELIRAKLLFEGYVSDSHEAEVSFMRNLGFNEGDVIFMNGLRYHRNGIKYYGKRFEQEYSGKVLGFLEKIYSRLSKEVKSD